MSLLGSTGVDFVAIDGESAVSRVGEFASTVWLLLSIGELVRGTVGGLRGIDGEAFLAAEVLDSGVFVYCVVVAVRAETRTNTCGGLASKSVQSRPIF